MSTNRTSPQGKFWLLTIPHGHFTPYLPRSIVYIKGQLELGTGGFLHWQIICCFEKKVRLTKVKEVFGAQAHCELSRSAAANDYVYKDETRVEGTQFELGKTPFRQNSKVDYKKMFDKAKAGNIDEIIEEEPELALRHYSTLRKIAVDYMKPTGQEKQCFIFWGPTATGKSHRAWEEAGMDAYPKIPSKVTWDGYQANNHQHAIFEEFTGQIGIEYLLRWTDKYPCIVDIKYTSSVLKVKKIWMTSNIDPREWFPNAKPAQIEALLRRFTIVHMDKKYEPPAPIPLIPLARMNAIHWRDEGDNDEDFEAALDRLEELNGLLY